MVKAALKTALKYINFTSKQVILSFFIVGFIIYSNSLFNPFIGDDFHQIKDNPSIHSIINIPSLFTHGTFRDEHSNNINNYYKPLLSTAFALTYFSFRENTFGYHLLQLLLHITNASLLYLIFKNFFPKNTSFVLSLLFLVHPINTEAVIHISALQEPLFVFFGLTSFYICTMRYEKWHKIAIPILLILSILSKESGVVFLLVIPAYCYIFKKQNFTRILQQILFVLITYLFLRFAVARIYFPQNPLGPIMTLSFGERIISIPKIIFFYIKTFLYPKELLVYQSWFVKSLNLNDFYLPLIFDFVFLLFFVFAGLYIYKKRKKFFKAYSLFAVSFLSGLAVHLQIIPLDQIVADRWFYFPIIGLVGLLGSIYNSLQIRKSIKLIIFLPFLILTIILLSLRVIERNNNWQSGISLISHDYQFNKDSYQIESALGNHYAKQGNLSEAEAHFLQAIKLFPDLDTYSTIGIFYLSNNKFNYAETAFENALEYSPKNTAAWYYLAISKYKLGNKEGAIYAATRAYTLNPSKIIKTLLSAIENNMPLNIK